MGRSLPSIRLVCAAAGLAGAALVLLAAGCATQPTLVRASSEPEFEEQVLQADVPVLVDFYKQGCATCVVLDGTFDDLAREYEGRVKFVKFELMTAFFGVRAPRVKEVYDISFFPTVILFLDGEERKRWVMKYSKAEYRAALEEAAAAWAKQRAAAPAGPALPAG
jgi:thioredoxin 1